MARKGDHALVQETPFQTVASYPRRHGVTFSPSASRSRLAIVDGGRRYEVRLTAEGEVHYSLDGGRQWRPIEPLVDTCTGEVPPPFLRACFKTGAGELLGPRHERPTCPRRPLGSHGTPLAGGTAQAQGR